jgi:spectinomycin phosphotransferase
MLEKPDLKDERVVACLNDQYGVLIAQVSFLPLGADRHTATYRIIADDETPHFLKLRRCDFDDTSQYLKSNSLPPNSTIEIALKSDRTLREA